MQLRDGIFAAVAMHAVRRLATDLFVHMHELSLRFHIGRKTGGLTRVLERGRNGIETLSRLIMSTGAPTVLEMALVLGIFLYQFGWRYGLVLVATLRRIFSLYDARHKLADRHSAQDERQRHRRQSEGDRQPAEL